MLEPKAPRGVGLSIRSFDKRYGVGSNITIARKRRRPYRLPAERTNARSCKMRQLVAILIFAMAATVAQAKQDGDARPTGRSKDPHRASVTTPDRLLWPQDVRNKARGKTVETIIPDICTGC